MDAPPTYDGRITSVPTGPDPTKVFYLTHGAITSASASYIRSITSLSSQDILLDESLLQRLERDTRTFFASQELYKSLRTPWRRGMLLVGPSGNGKSIAAKLALRMIPQEVSVIVVRSISSRVEERQKEIGEAFRHAREKAPCVLLWEHVEVVASAAEGETSVRAQFLEEMDVGEENEGILVIATTNRPERLDEAVLKRPSRFDTRYTFPLPSLTLRKAFFARYVATRLGSSSIDFDSQEYSTGAINDMDSLADEVARRTDGWSFASLEEMMLSFALERKAGWFAGSAGEDILLTGAVSETEKAVPFQDLLKHITEMGEQMKGGNVGGTSGSAGTSGGTASSGAGGASKTATARYLSRR